ncbi:hypothetical protein GSI_11752 [Ganoderma sinense ZZ0214-1]|uniref:MARVEL domain-containing protein n=1 Tax=Ganoderma sinense ZZ0214-1 TaxID=1077348 RepID=A0A2G8RXF0_9APHY|nr:hypothetical protein GSI_11752 [Ganoderma sinense ZZ0214-1]
MANWLQIYRLVSFGFAIFSGIIVAALAAQITAFAEAHFRVYYIYAALAIATGGLTMITLPIMLVIDFLRRGAFTSWVLIELIWISVLWVLWIATGALAVNNTSAIFTTCDFVADWANQLCRETQAIEAFSFLAWLTLMSYTITLLVVSLIAQNRGQSLWKLTVRDYASLPPSQSSAFNPNPGALPPQQFQQQQPLMAMTPAPQQQPIYQQPYQNGSGFNQQQPQAQYPPPQPAPSPSVISQASYGMQGQQPQQAYGQAAYPQV